MKIENFKIEGLYGHINCDLELNDNKLILIGENGSCKTTIIKILFYVLSAQWSKLYQFNFDKITITIDGDKYPISRSDVLCDEKMVRQILSSLPFPIRNRMIREGAPDLLKIKECCELYGISFDSILSQNLSCNERDFFLENVTANSLKTLEKKFSEFCYVYLPTYRRIEQDLEVVLGKKAEKSHYFSDDNLLINEKDLSSCRYIEMIHFGMGDVENAILNNLQKLKDTFRTNLNQLTLGYLGEIIDNQYSNVDLRKIKKTSNETLMSIMGRVDDSILTKEKKQKLLSMLENLRQEEIPDEHDKVLCHYILKLLDLQKHMNKNEDNIKNFVEICSRYIVNKRFEYDSSQFTFKIKTDFQDIKLKHLSSGEKQIVSLFSLLNLVPSKKFFILIDEPELSLSVKWQEHFLNDISASSNCRGLVAVTHSPFIISDKMRCYAHGLGEFLNERG